MNEVVRTEPTPFADHDVHCRLVQMTAFVVMAYPQRTEWPCELPAPSPVLTRSARWWRRFTSADSSAASEQAHSSILTSAASAHAAELTQWFSPVLEVLVEHDGEPHTLARDLEVPVEQDRRLYALAAVQRLQRLLRLSQDETASLVRVSRPTLWNWEQGRTPQERSLRRLYEIASIVDLVVDAIGDDQSLDLIIVERFLQLDQPLIELLRTDDGPAAVLDKLFENSRASAPLPTLLPSLEELVVDEDDDTAEQPKVTPHKPTGARQLRRVTRRDR